MSESNAAAASTSDDRPPQGGTEHTASVLTFDEVFGAELAEIEKHRKSLTNESNWRELSKAVDPKKPLAADLCGLAISGGGIRSATFALGVLQGLARIGILDRFDYLSTVSGGGYIGSWFSAWCRKVGIDKVVDRLDPNHRQVQPGDKQGKEPDEIRHLRYYSRYLAPRPGLLSVDGWILVTIYVRNFLLNLLVLSLFAMGALVLARLIVDFYAVVYNLPVDSRWLKYANGGGIFLTAIAALATSRGIPTKSGDNCHTVRRAYIASIVLWILAAFVLSLVFTWGGFEKYLDDHKTWSISTMCLSMGVVMAALCSLKRSLGLNIRRILRSFIAGLLGGLLLFGAAHLLGEIKNWDLVEETPGLGDIQRIAPVAFCTTLCVPLVLVVFVTTNFLQLGLIGPGSKGYEREWWAAWSARLLRGAAVWMTIFLIAVFGPWLVNWLINSNGMYLKTLIPAGWIGTTIAGLLTGKGPQTKDTKRGGIREWITKIAPPVFLIGVLIAVAWLTTSLMYAVYARGDSKLRLLNRDSVLVLSDLNTLKHEFTIGDADDSTVNISVEAALIGGALVLFALSYYLGQQVGVNRFSLHELYRNRLVRCYLGAVRAGKRNPNPITNFDGDDNICLSPEKTDDGNRPKGAVETEPLPGPLHLINAALNLRVGEVLGNNEGETLALIDRKAESFTFSQLHCGSQYTGYRPSKTYAEGIDLGTAMAISGAAVSPNMGYHSSPSVTALLTVFNVRLGAWLRNPKFPVSSTKWSEKAQRLLSAGHAEPGLLTLLTELTGSPDADRNYVYLSDGGHFENMGVYELLRRKCRFILAIDAGADPQFLQEDIGSAVRLAQIDFGTRVQIDISATRPDERGFCKSHVAVGRIFYQSVLDKRLRNPNYDYDNNEGIFIYLRAGLTGDESADVLSYHAVCPVFPNETTLDQFYSESQFQSYRALGMHSAMTLFRGATIGGNAEPVRIMMSRSGGGAPTGRVGQSGGGGGGNTTADSGTNVSQEGTRRRRPLDGYSTKAAFESLYDFWLARPPGFVNQYTGLTEAWIDLHSKLRNDPKLTGLARRLYGEIPPDGQPPEKNSDAYVAERLMIKEVLTVLEKAYLSLDFEHFWQHPANQGLLHLFNTWVRSQYFQEHWGAMQAQFCPMFQHFIVGLVQRETSNS